MNHLFIYSASLYFKSVSQNLLSLKNKRHERRLSRQDDRVVLAAIFYRVQTGIQWRYSSNVRFQTRRITLKGTFSSIGVECNICNCSSNVKLLIDAGADLQIQNNEGKTAKNILEETLKKQNS